MHISEKLKILVTRPKPKGEELCKIIHDAGAQAFYLPVIEILPPEDVKHFEQQLLHLDQFDWVIFTSPQAVYQIHELPKQIKIMAIGEGTAFALKEKGILPDSTPSVWNSEGLLELPLFKAVKDKKIAIIKGAGGRELLKKELMSRGAVVTEMIAYRRSLPKINVGPYLNLVNNHALNVIICTSNECLQNLKILLADIWHELIKIPVLVISKRIAAYAKDLGFEKIILADNASHEAILKALMKGKNTMNEKKLASEEIQNNVKDDMKNNAKDSVNHKNYVVFLLAILCIGIAFLGWMNFHYLKNATAQNQDTQKTITELQKDNEGAQKQLMQLQEQLKDQSQTLNGLRQTQNGYNRNEWRVLEAEFLAQIADNKLQLEGNVSQAIMLLQYADQQIRDLNDATLLPLRKALTDDIASLQAVPLLDVSGTYLRLSAVNDEISKLNLPNKPIEKTEIVAPTNQNLPWWKRGLQDTWKTLRQIITVHYNQNGAPALVMPDQQDFLFQNLHAKIDTAIWALLHQQPIIYRASLEDASKWIKQYFLSDAQPVQSVLTTLTQLQAIDIHPAAPKISGTLQAFHEYFAQHNIQENK